jgi:prophage antirepressor-like protein
MDIVKAFNSNDLHTAIIIKGDVQNPLFRASDIGVVLDMGNIRTTINDFNETEKVVHSMDTPGGLQNVSFLTEKGLYKVLFKSRKPIAEKFQNWVCEVIKELRLKGTYDLQQQLEQAKVEITQIEDKNKKEYEQQLAKEKILEREKVLLKEFETIGAIFYIIKIKTFENGQYIVKVGESRIGIVNRYKEHKYKYDECLLLDCFLVNKSKDFETFIKENEYIRPSKVTDLLGHENEQELFLIGKNLSYKTLLNLVNNNTKYFNDNNNEVKKLELELEILKIKENSTHQSNNDNENIKELLKMVNTLNTKINSLEKTNKEILEKLNLQQTKLVTGFSEPLVTLGPRLQKINPETFQLIKVYETIAECMKENPKIKRPSINKAIEENTIYHGFRWLLVDRSLDPNIILSIILNIQPTKITRPQNLGYIAKLNKEKTEILNVYLDRKTAATENEYASSAALDNPVKNFTLTNSHYYVLYDSCEEDLREEFVIKNDNKEPILYKNGVGQYDTENKLIQEFICKYDCIKSLHISDKTLEKALTKNMLYNGTYFKFLGCKVKCF